ncbi:hypothetical protein M5K25_000358 [Dendrobium thyrsiflorum]|uniref:Reverse transcriptase zinc-binding domain-containing protein n=1 Tax=Dendrobium thyrsiflorum TaxID=117978 RepID=A0ABD0VTQ7_DENTH
MALSPGDFPPLSPSSLLGPVPPPLSTSFAENLAATPPTAPFPLDFVLPAQKLAFVADDLTEGASLWSLSLVGYSLGVRPYYERLLAAMRKVWKLKGELSLLSLADGFFLLKFISSEDFNMVWTGGPWFLLGKPFILQKWSPKFRPKRDEDASIPIWVKIIDLPLALWTPKGISRIASFIGIPIYVDSLMANRTRLTFARVCVQISKDSALPDEIPISIDGEDQILKVLYDWKPSRCEGCGSLVHPYSLCPSNPSPLPSIPPPRPNRGRSSSRNPGQRPPSTSKPPIPKPTLGPGIHSAVFPLADTTPSTGVHFHPQPGTAGPPPTPNPSVQPHTCKDPIIPNLNSPTKTISDGVSSSGNSSSQDCHPSVPLHNKFGGLGMDEECQPNHIEVLSLAEALASTESPHQDQGKNSVISATSTKSPESYSKPPSKGFNSPEKVMDCKGFVRAHNLKFICILEAKVQPDACQDPWFLNSHRVFDNENSCNNFSFSSPGSIWLKWDSSTFSFNPTVCSSQFIHGILSAGSEPPLLLTVVYASTTVEERKVLWESIRGFCPNPSQPWMIIGDFNCFRFGNEKFGGNPVTPSRLGELNNVVFYCGLQDLASVGLFYTWSNNRVDLPIHIKLDRILVNPAVLDFYPTAFYRVYSPSCSDHSPLIFFSSSNSSMTPRFMFKNFWIHMDGFWDDVVGSFTSFRQGSPTASFYQGLQNLKRALKKRNWVSSHFIASSIHELKMQQYNCLLTLQGNPLDPALNTSLKHINCKLADLQLSWASWVSQRAKANWLSKGENDLGFLFAKIKGRKNLNQLKEIVTPLGTVSDHHGIAEALIHHFKAAFNPPKPPNEEEHCRVQFLKFSIANTLSYWIRGSIIPKAVRHSISKLCSRFLFHGDTKDKKLHIIAWNSVTLPKSLGGLNIPSIDSLYLGVACSYIWRFLCNTSIWCAWLKAKYISPWKHPPLVATKYWKFICSTASKVISKLSFKVGSNCNFSMLWDPWCFNKPLGDLYSLNCRESLLVKDFIVDGHWKLPDYFPDTISTLLNTIPILEISDVTWAGSNQPTFKSFTDSFYEHLEPVSWFKYVWHKRHSLRFSVYAWMAVIGKLKTADLLIKRQIMVHPGCCFCQTTNETHQHLLFECDFTFTVISTLFPSLAGFLFRPNVLQVFDFLDMASHLSAKDRGFCFLVVCCSVYFIWRERNNRRFSGIWESPQHVVFCIKHAVNLIIRRWKDYDGITAKCWGVLGALFSALGLHVFLLFWASFFSSLRCGCGCVPLFVCTLLVLLGSILAWVGDIVGGSLLRLVFDAGTTCDWNCFTKDFAGDLAVLGGSDGDDRENTIPLWLPLDGHTALLF